MYLVFDIIFLNSPVVPDAFLIHEKKLQYCHEQFFQTVSSCVPHLSKISSTPLVTDEEIGIINAVANTLPNIPRLCCWNHLIKDVRRWLRAHDAPSADISVYICGLRNLLHKPSEEECTLQKWNC